VERAPAGGKSGRGSAGIALNFEIDKIAAVATALTQNHKFINTWLSFFLQDI
jgi:hypothetical protein